MASSVRLGRLVKTSLLKKSIFAPFFLPPCLCSIRSPQIYRLSSIGCWVDFIPLIDVGIKQILSILFIEDNRWDIEKSAVVREQLAGHVVQAGAAAAVSAARVTEVFLVGSVDLGRRISEMSVVLPRSFPGKWQSEQDTFGTTSRQAEDLGRWDRHPVKTHVPGYSKSLPSSMFQKSRR